MRPSALLCLCLTGCVATTAEQSADRVATTQPGGTVVQQAGGGRVAIPVAIPVEAPGWTGIAVSEAMPIGLGFLMFMIIVLSHRREMRRILQGTRCTSGYKRRSP